MMRIVTFNLRYDHAEDGDNRFLHRLDAIKDKIASSKPDLLCFQEVTPSMDAALRAILPDHLLLGHARGRTLLDDEATPIAIRHDLFRVLDCGTFWLSDTPRMPGSRFEKQSICPRICTWARLRYLPKDQIISVYNTHLDHEAAYAREKGLSLILDTIVSEQRRIPSPVFLTGDFNLTPADQTHRLPEACSFPLVDLTQNISSSFHDFGRLKEPCKIDYVFTDQATYASSSFQTSVWHADQRGRFYSDHDAIQIDWLS